MQDENKLCHGKSSRGTPCKSYPQKGSEFCRHHQPNLRAEKERNKIRDFFLNHKDGIVGFLAGTITDSVTGDIYDYVKERLKLEHLVPPVPIESANKDEKSSELVDTGEIALHFRTHKDLSSLYSLLPSIKIGMSRIDCVQLLGTPDKYEGRIRVGIIGYDGPPIGVDIDVYECKENPAATLMLKSTGTQSFKEKLESITLRIIDKDELNRKSGIEIPLKPVE